VISTLGNDDVLGSTALGSAQRCLYCLWCKLDGLLLNPLTLFWKLSCFAQPTAFLSQPLYLFSPQLFSFSTLPAVLPLQKNQHQPTHVFHFNALTEMQIHSAHLDSVYFHAIENSSQYIQSYNLRSLGNRRLPNCKIHSFCTNLQPTLINSYICLCVNSPLTVFCCCSFPFAINFVVNSFCCCCFPFAITSLACLFICLCYDLLRHGGATLT